MAFEITIPRLGWSMEEGTFVRWLKQDGEHVRAGEPLFELEGEKAAQDIEAVDSGVLHIPATAPKPESIVSVGAVIGFLLAEGESVPSAGLVVPTSNPTIATSPATSSAVTTSSTVIASSSEARPTTDPHQPKASPRARRVAGELGVDWTSLTGTGRHGRIRERDVRAAAKDRPQIKVAWTQRPTGASLAITSRRRTIADRMLASHLQTAPVTLTTRVDATNLVNLRMQFKSAAGAVPIPSYSDIVLKLVATALCQHPLLTAQWHEERFTIPEASHIGFAVDTGDGLLVPVLRDVASRTLIDIAAESRRLIECARAGKLSSAEMQGGVFTITNLGAFGIDAFTPIINLPETAVLGLGRIRKEPVVFESQIVARDQLTLSLTFDHRLVDGGPAARFLQTISLAIENPSAWLLKDV